MRNTNYLKTTIAYSIRRFSFSFFFRVLIDRNNNLKM